MDPDDPSTWDRPVVRLGSQSAFRQAVASRRWLDAIEHLAVRKALAHPHLAGTVVVRFPVDGDPGDDGWDIDTSYQPDGHDDRWVDHRSRGRALLMVVLFSDTGDNDGPTRLRVGSHHDIARGLVPFGDRRASPLGPDGSHIGHRPPAHRPRDRSGR